MPDPLPVIADIPSLAPALGFPEYVDALADAVRGGEPPQFTIGLYGAWGSGKSSLLNGIYRRLAEDDSSVIPVHFDAWRFERSEHIVVPLLHRIAAAVEEGGESKVAEHLRRALRSLVFGLRLSVGAVQFAARDAAAGWETDDPLPALDEAFAKPFDELRKIPDALDGRRVAVLIDDLDRCSPGKIVTVVEAINLVMDIPGFVFVLALDYDVLIDAVNREYPHVSGHRFVEKIIQLPFRVPPLTFDAGHLLEELVPEQETGWQRGISEDFVESVNDIARLALRSNPRQIKRLINSFLLINRIVERRGLEIDSGLLAATIGLQLGWPGVYEQFQDAILANDTKPAELLTEDESDGLAVYARRFFTSVSDPAQLRQVVALTAVVSSETVTDGETRVSELREEHLEAFIEQLRERGFVRGPRSDRLFYNEARPNERFALSDSRYVVRFEKRDGLNAPWRLWESYLVTRETHLALQVLEQPDRHFTNRK